MGMPVPPAPTVYPPTNAGYAAPPPPPPQMQMPQPDTSYAEMPPPPRRAGTPFIPPLGPGQYGPNDDRSSSSSSDDQSLDYRPRPPPQHHFRARSYDLHERQRRNPSPTPPKDVFASSPYVHLLRDLQKPVDEVLAERQQNLPPRAVMIAPVQAPLMSLQMPRSRSVKKKKGGLFSRLTGRHHHDRELDAIAEQPQPIVNILTQQPITIPAPQGRPMPGGGTEYVYMPPMAQPPPPNQPPPQVPVAQTPSTAPLRMPTPTPSHRMASPSPHHMASPSPHHMPSPAPQRMPSPTPSHRSHRSRAASPSPRSPDGRPPPIKIHMENGFSGLIHYSPHNVYYERKVFPTAYHLLEARKFMDHQPDIVERIRTCGSGMDGIEQARRVAEDMARFVRPDWDQVVIPIVRLLLLLHS
ncbi:hypothetical protein K474DRAFT_1667961 [Panus rudis PR-1116 ss-1]|nr:hypothetical protein K474DRAFT_1667961 [Panus rudis PR-1116 ss-1]